MQDIAFACMIILTIFLLIIDALEKSLLACRRTVRRSDPCGDHLATDRIADARLTSPNPVHDLREIYSSPGESARAKVID